jgi:flagellar biosynthesis GTPase FlhF
MSSTKSKFRSMTLAQRLKVVNSTYISYPRFDEIFGAIEYCHYFSSCKDEPECLFLSGHTGVGKTTIYHTYASRYPQSKSKGNSLVSKMLERIKLCSIFMGC